ncbi:MAG: NAD-dependent protein deacylase [Trueperaceae bacterium]|nr:NAD-dependent protein deacylase [Trueperaceae bacterium]
MVVLTGAGVSVESGLPPFRGADGWWRGHDPTRLATPKAFAADPALVSEWYDTRRLAALAAHPNAGHHAIAALERHVATAAGRFALLTQNVDGLHRRAGSEHLIELHGSITVWRDHRSGRKVTPEPEPFTSHPQPGPDGGWLRPDVVWFGESVPRAAWSAAEAALSWCDLFLVVGTSAAVYPAAGLVGRAVAAGAVTVEVNVEATPAAVQHRLIGPSGEVLPRLLEAAFGIDPLEVTR